MKKNFLSVAILVIALSFSSCKSTQLPNDYQAYLAYKQQNSSQQSLVQDERGTHLNQDICEILQEEKPGLRAVGHAEHFKLSTAKNIAALQARAELAASLETVILNSMRDGSAQDEQYSADDLQGSNAYDGLALTEQDIKAVVNGIVRNSIIIKTSTYIKANKQYNVYVCVEYSNGPKEIAKEVTQKVQQMIPDDKKEELVNRLDNLTDGIERRLLKVTNE